MADRPQQQRFHGLFDTVAELNRMREFWRAGIDPPQEEPHGGHRVDPEDGHLRAAATTW